GQPPSNVYLENSKGYAVGYTALIRPTLVSNFHYGYTRQGAQNTGFQNSPVAYFRDMDTLYSRRRGLTRIIPVHTLSEDVSWTKGAPSFAFGGIGRFISNDRASTLNSFSEAYGNASWLLGTGGQFLVADAANRLPYKRQFSNILGLLTQLNHQINYDLQG